jgi:hypothetical protein
VSLLEQIVIAHTSNGFGDPITSFSLSDRIHEQRRR